MKPKTGVLSRVRICGRKAVKGGAYHPNFPILPVSTEPSRTQFGFSMILSKMIRIFHHRPNMERPLAGQRDGRCAFSERSELRKQFLA